MKPFPGGLDTLLATKIYVFADLYQFALSDGVTFLRYTTADADVSYPQENRIVFSERFDQSQWQNSSLGTYGGLQTPLVGAIDPYGTNLGSLVIENLGIASAHIVSQNVTYGGVTQTLSIYAKPFGRNWIYLQLFDGSTIKSAYFNIATGDAGTTSAGVTTRITPAANGYYRCSISCAMSGSGSIAFYPASGDGGNVYAGDGISGVILFGAMLQSGMNVSSYIQNATSSPITTASLTFSSRGPFMDGLQSQSRGHWKAGLDVDSWIVGILPPVIDPVTLATYPNKIYNQPWLAAARGGALDGATVDIHRAYWAAWPSRSAGILVPPYVLVDYFAGRVATVQIKRTSALITVNSHMEILQRTMPRNVYQSQCRHALFDAGCTVSAAATKQTGSVVSVVNNGKFGQTQVIVPANYWALGRLVWTSGANVGFSAMIRNFDVATGLTTLIAPMPFTVAVGDIFDIYPGCDKLLTTCTTKFANAANFGGQPFIPAPETAV